MNVMAGVLARMTDRGASAGDVLAEPFARGEIEADEFCHRRDALRT
jgi:uncharacterized membrane protein